MPPLLILQIVGGRKMRGLQTTDVFGAARLITRIGIRDEIRKAAEQAEADKGKKIKIDFGFDLMFAIFEKATSKNAEKEIYEFIASLFECTPEEVMKMNPVKMLRQLEEVANIEEWKDFFGYVRRLIMKK